MNPAEWEFENANREQLQMLTEALDNCFRCGAPKEDLELLAWHAGCPDWSPAKNVIQLRR